MLDIETIKKNEYIYDNHIACECREIIEEYKRVLDITESQARKIITSNASATVFAWNKNFLSLIGLNKSVDLLIKCTLFRQGGGNYPITQDEKDIITKYYGFNIDEFK